MMHDNYLLKVLRVSLMSTLLLGLCSCAGLQSRPSSETDSPTHAAAELSFLNGDFQEAFLEYELIYDTALSPEDKRDALYGMACTQIVLAQNDAQLVEAVANLEKWNGIKTSDSFIENQDLLILALKQQIKHNEWQKQLNAVSDKQLRKIIADQKKEISQMATTVKQLENQLRQLEAIDKIYQEKRKP